MNRKLLLAASIVALGLSTAAHADEITYSITCPDLSGAVYTIDETNGLYTLIGNGLEVGALTERKWVLLEYTLVDDESSSYRYESGTYIDLTDLVVYSFQSFPNSDEHGIDPYEYGTVELGSCYVTGFDPIEV